MLLSFVSVLDFVTELRDVGKESYTLSHAVLYILLTTPRRMYEMFPTVAVIGSLLGLGGLAARSELTVMRAVGLSQMADGPGRAGAVDGADRVDGGQHRNGRTGRRATRADPGQQQVPATDHGARIPACGRAKATCSSTPAATARRMSRTARAGSSCEDVRLYQFDAKGRLLSLAHARQAEHRNAGWTLQGVERVWFDERSVRVEKKDSERWQTELDDSTIAAAAGATALPEQRRAAQQHRVPAPQPARRR